MKYMFAIALMTLLVVCHQPKEMQAGELTLDNEQRVLSYALGMKEDFSAIEAADAIDRAALLAGINDALDGAETKLSKKDAEKFSEEIKKLKEKQMLVELKRLQKKNKIKADAFLQEHAKKPGVIVTESGLQYEVIKEGHGPKPNIIDDVKVLYDGHLMDGTVFDPYHKPDVPARFNLNKVIRGWAEGLQLMSVGSKYRFVLPPALAFGDQWAGGNIPPNAVLVFDIELLSVDKQKKQIQQSGNYSMEINP